MTPEQLAAIVRPIPNLHEMWKRYQRSDFRRAYLNAWANGDPDKQHAVNERLKEQSPMDVNDIARICHEANTALCIVNGDQALPHWDDLEETYRDSTRKGVAAALAGAGPKELHESWITERTGQGWVFGEVLDRDAKVHPCLVPYEELPEKQRRKDALFGAVVAACRVPTVLNRPYESA